MKRIDMNFDFYVMFLLCFLVESAWQQLVVFIVGVRKSCQP